MTPAAQRGGTLACGADAQCVQGSCTTCAVPGATCGLDACGQPIGACPSGQVCDGVQCVPATTNQNPTPAELDQAIAQLVQEFPITWKGKDGAERVDTIPTRVVKAMLWQESHWRQYGDDGAVLQGKNGDSTGYGLMQVNGPNDDPTMLAMSWMDNLRQGISVLRSKWVALAYQFEDPSILENWFYPVAAYNGLSLDAVKDPSAPDPKEDAPYYQAPPRAAGQPPDLPGPRLRHHGGAVPVARGRVLPHPEAPGRSRRAPRAALRHPFVDHARRAVVLPGLHVGPRLHLGG